jgi:hypothetical protein
MGSPNDNHTWPPGPPDGKQRIDWLAKWFPKPTELQTLPEELLVMIIDELEGDTANLSRLALANKKFSRLTKETLYRSVRVGQGLASSSLIYLVRTLLEHPEYAALIKNLLLMSYFSDTRGHVAGSPYPRHRFGRNETDAFDRFDNRNYAFLNDCLRKVDSWVPDKRGADLLVAMQWKAAVLQRQGPAFASLLLAMCPSLKMLSFHINKVDGAGQGARLTLPCIFGFAAADEIVEAESCLSEVDLPLFLRSGLHMPEVQHLKISIGNNIDIVRLGFRKLMTLDVCLWVSHDNGTRYGSTRVGPGQVKSIPGVRNLILRVDHEELVPSAGKQISRLVRDVDFPQLTSLTVVLERSPRKHKNCLHTQVTFDRLMSQLKQSAQTLLNNLEEFKVLITDDTAAFDKEFLHRFQPCTSLAWLPRLKKLTIPWQALSHRSKLPDHMIDSEEALPMADLPPSLEVLRVLYPHAQTPLQLAKLFPSAMGQLNQLQEVEILFDKHWGMLDVGLRPLWQRVLEGLPAKVTLGWMPSVKDEIGALIKSSSK